MITVNECFNPSIEQHELWRLSYRGRRYLQHSSEDALWERFRDVVANIISLSPSGMIEMLAPEDGGAYWLKIFTHILEECILRGTGLPPGLLKDSSLPIPT